MRRIRSVLFLIEADNPGSTLESIIEDGAEAMGYTIEPYEINEFAEGYYKMKKE